MRISIPPRARKAFEQAWPANVWSIGLDRLDFLGVDDRGQLYWNGQKIQMEQLRLTWWQKLGTVLVTISAMIAAGAASVSAWGDYQEEIRKEAAISGKTASDEAEREAALDHAVMRYPESSKAREDAARKVHAKP